MALEKFFSHVFEYREILRSHHLQVVILLAVGFALASILGYLAYRIKISPIIGYLCAGYLIGPYSPGFVADLKVAEQLAEIGVVLMMFGVGLNFRVKDLLKVKRIALPGAIGQTFFSSLCSILILFFFGWSFSSGLILGLAVGVASTVVLVRMLVDTHLLKTEEGHIAVGWLIVEDIITVLILLLLPNIATLVNDSKFSLSEIFASLGLVFVKIVVLLFLLKTLGRRFTSYTLSRVARTKSHELFTLTVLALTFIFATGSAILFGISIALGAFIAGVIIGQTELREQAWSHSLAMKDAFIVVFFLSVGMLFNPSVMIKNFPIFLSIMAVILLLKPLVAWVITILLKYPMRTALIVAFSLAQIGEFSFILSEEAMKYNLITDEGYDIIVACALVSIALNPLIFKFLRLNKANLKTSN